MCKDCLCGQVGTWFKCACRASNVHSELAWILGLWRMTKFCMFSLGRGGELVLDWGDWRLAQARDREGSSFCILKERIWTDFFSSTILGRDANLFWVWLNSSWLFMRLWLLSWELIWPLCRMEIWFRFSWDAYRGTWNLLCCIWATLLRYNC